MVFLNPRKLVCSALFLFAVETIGLAAASREPAKGQDVVELPAFVVDGATGSGPALSVHWYYVELPGMRLLSCCSEAVMEQVVSELRDQVRLYGWTLPPGLKLTTGAPLSIILDDRPAATLRLPLLARDTKAMLLAPGSRVVGVGLLDWDLATSYHQLVKSQTRSLGSALVSQACNAILTQTPGWGHVQPVLARARGSATAVANGVDTFDPVSNRQEMALPLRNVAELFGAPPAAPVKGKPFASEAETARWFGRWLLFADEGRHQAELWNFARSTILAPKLDDESAERSFGLTVAELNRRVVRLRESNQKSATMHFRLPPIASMPFVTFRDATPEEIACSLSQWCLLAWRHNPNLGGPMRDAARRAIARVQKSGEMTPRVTAMLGLLEAMDGNAARARELFESVPNPLDLNLAARFELAKLRFAEATMQNAKTPGKLSAPAAAAILAPLLPFLSEPPGDSDPLALIVQSWLQSPQPPSREELAKLASAARFFPKDDALLYQTADLCAQQSMTKEAAELAAIGQAAASSDATRASFAELERRISGGAAPK